MFVKGNVVNVFVDIQLIVNVFFRQLDEYVIIVVKLKKRFFYKFVCFFENVCFNKVMNDYLWREIIDNDNQEVVKEFVGIFFSIDECEIELNDDGFCEVVVDDNI